MGHPDPAKRAEELREMIRSYDYHYYVLDSPLISDYEYDKLYDMLIKESSPKKREEISVKMQKIFLQEVPFLINVFVSIGTAYRPTLHGHVMHPGHTGWACIDRIWMEK